MAFIPIDYAERAAGYLDAQDLMASDEAQSIISSKLHRSGLPSLFKKTLQGSWQYQFGFLSALLESDSLLFLRSKGSAPLDESVSVYGFRAFLDQNPTDNLVLEANLCIRPFNERAIHTEHPNLGVLHSLDGSEKSDLLYKIRLRQLILSAFKESSLFSISDLRHTLDVSSGVIYDAREAAPLEDFKDSLFQVALEAELLHRATSLASPSLKTSRPLSL